MFKNREMVELWYIHGMEYYVFTNNYNLKNMRGFPGSAVVGNLPADAGDTGSSPGLGRSHMPQRD